MAATQGAQPARLITIIGVILAVALIAGVYFAFWGNPNEAGPHGGDVVPLADGDTYAELLANADTGVLMVQTWDEELKRARPIKNEPFAVGSCLRAGTARERSNTAK